MFAMSATTDMPPSKISARANNIDRRRPRRAAAPAPDEQRVEAVAAALSSLQDPGAITAAIARELMEVLPAVSVTMRQDAQPSSEPRPGRLVAPLETRARDFGALEIELKPGFGTTAAQRALTAALARECALALERLALVAAIDRLASDLRALAQLAGSASLPPAARVAEAERIGLAHLDELRAMTGGASAVAIARTGSNR
jgi:hypothetical protein